jgi:chemotaxis protein MotB
MTKLFWFTLFLLTLAVGLGGFALYSWEKWQDYDTLRAELAECALVLEQNVLQRGELQKELAEQMAMVDSLQREKEKAIHARGQLEQEMRQALESRDVTISELEGNLMVDILDRILFDSGQAELKPEGQALLRRIAEILDQYPDRNVHVIGHTDNVPIRASSWSRFPSNWELSTGRATAAVRFLVEEAGVNPGRLAAIGFGEHQPMAENSTAEGRARNRRIALMVLPSQFNPYALERELAQDAADASPPSDKVDLLEPPSQQTTQLDSFTP